MSELAEEFAALRQFYRGVSESREVICKRQRAEYPYAVDVVEFNNGYHWRVTANGKTWDFWPRTGTYMALRSLTERGKVRDFLTLLQKMGAA